LIKEHDARCTSGIIWHHLASSGYDTYIYYIYIIYIYTHSFEVFWSDMKKATPRRWWAFGILRSAGGAVRALFASFDFQTARRDCREDCGVKKLIVYWCVVLAGRQLHPFSVQESKSQLEKWFDDLPYHFVARRQQKPLGFRPTCFCPCWRLDGC
jgi:hypothetical protein